MKPESSSIAMEHASLAAAVEQAADSFVITGIDGKIQYVNPAFTAMTGYTSEEIVGQNPRILKSGRHPAAFYKELWSTILSGRVWHGEVINRRKDGALYHEEMRVAPVRNANGATTGYVAIKHDVTERRAAQEAQEFLASIVENSEDSIIACAPEGTVRSFNHGAETIFGYSANEVIGRHMSMLVPPERSAALEHLAQKLLRGEGFSQYEGFCLRKDGRKIEVSLTGVPIKNSGGEVIGFSNILRDITQRKQFERQLRESEERFRSLADSSPAMMWVTNAKGEHEFINRTYREFSGITSEEAQAGKWRSLLHPDDAPGYLAAFDLAIRERTSFSAEGRARRADGQWRLIGSRGEARFSPQGEYLGHIGLRADITERKKADEERQFQHSLTRTIHEVSLDGILVVNEEGNIASRNARFLEVWHIPPSGTRVDFAIGAPDEPLLSAVLDRLVDPEAFLKRVRMLNADRNADDRCEIELKDGRVLERYSTALRAEDGGYLGRAWFFRDITERKQAEADLVLAREDAEAASRQVSAQNAILDNERKILRTFIDNVPDFMYVKDIEGRFIVANSKVAQFMGAKKPEDMLGKTDFDFFPREIATGFYEDEQRAIRSGQPLVDREEIVGEQATGGVRYILSTKVPFFDSEGNVTGIAGIGRDITMRKATEDALRESNRELQEKTDLANKLAMDAESASRAKSEFLANMSHEIRTPMNGVLGMNGLLLSSNLDQEQRHYAEVVEASAKALLTVIDDILDFSKVEAGKLQIETIDFNLHALMGDFAELMAERVGEKHLEFICAVAPDVFGHLQGDPGRLRQVLLNLASNALKFTRQGEVVVRVVLISETDDAVFLRFSVRDTGIGIPANKQQMLFASFTQVDASTTRQYGGTGLGLAISKKLVELMGGKIGLESKEGAGSEFWFTIRLAKQLANPQVDYPKVPVKGTRILVVDDNATNRELIIAQLESWGAIAAAVESGSTALDYLRYATAAGAPFQLAVLDMMMPGMNGETLGLAILADETLKGIPLVMMTSMGHRGDAHRFKEIGFAAYLIKPVRQSDLLDCLVAVLSGERQKEAGAIITRHSLRELRRGNARILLVEDNLTNQEVARGMLQRMGWNADVAANGKEALLMLATESYDLVLMDVQMPEMDGYEATRQIRDPRSAVLNHNIPIIATTAHAMAGDAELCLAAGMSDYISKPIDPKFLAKLVEKWLAQKVHRASGEAPAESAMDGNAPPPKPEIESLVFNSTVFLERMMGDEEFAREVAAGFVEELPSLLSTLKEEFARGNLETIWKQAHKMKGSAANVGGETLRDAAMEVEQAGKTGDLARVAHWMPELETQAVRLDEALQQWAT